MGETTAYLSLGANLGDRRENMRNAVRLLKSDSGCSVTLVSSLYLTKPVGVENQPDFFNAAIELKTTLDARELLRLCKDIEKMLGRKRTIPWGPRVIDIDILMYDDAVICEEDLSVPHPYLMERAFVLIPLADIASDLVIPGAGVTAREAALRVGQDGIERIEGGSWSE